MAGVVFINYRSMDSHSYAALLYTELARRFGGEHVFLDAESIPAGADFAEELLDRVRSARVLLAVIGPHWLTATDADGRRRIDDPADWIRRELSEAFAAGVRVIPILTEQVEIPAATELPSDIAALSRCQYRRLRYREPIADLARIIADITPPRRRAIGVRRRVALLAVLCLALAAIFVTLTRSQPPSSRGAQAAAGHTRHAATPVPDHGPTTSAGRPTTGATATSVTRNPATITNHTPVVVAATTTTPPRPVGCGAVPCRTDQDTTLWAVETGAPNSGICMISADVPGAGGEQTGPDSTCHATDAQFQLFHGSIANTAQFASVTYPGTCMVTPDGYNTYLRTCDPTDPNQWFVLPPSGTTGQIHPYGSGACLTVHMVANGAIYFAPCGTADQTWQLWQIHTW